MAPGRGPATSGRVSLQRDPKGGGSEIICNRRTVAGKALPFDDALLFYNLAYRTVPAGCTAGRTETGATKILARWPGFLNGGQYGKAEI